LGIQYVRYRMTPGKKPASATPKRNRTTYSEVSFQTKHVAAKIRPQVTMIRAIQNLAPTLCMIRLLGISKMA